ncbi:MAG: D-alanine--D-alanine ligase [Gammaproteobacteria bacterium]|nr:D-alanine--D-alanine ligase [Gammaproteobacteria bacterium]
MQANLKIDELRIREYGKVAVLMGGLSAEREISLETGTAVCDALCRKGVDAHAIDSKDDVLEQLKQGGFDRAFIALHGRGGEDGVIQGALVTSGIPYTGSGVLGSALAMDKTRSKWIWRQHGIATPISIEIKTLSDLQRASTEIGFPMMVKPVHEGSSCGAAKVVKQAALQAAWNSARQFDDRVMAERWIEGAEYTASVLNGEVLPVIRLQTPREFYDYQAKYLEETTQYICPCGLAGEDEQAIARQALQAFELINASGWGRVDLIVDEAGTCWIIEVNTVPGMTGHSLVPMAAKQAGIEFDTLVLMILETSMQTAEQLKQAIA